VLPARFVVGQYPFDVVSIPTAAVKGVLAAVRCPFAVGKDLFVAVTVILALSLDQNAAPRVRLSSS
jgi:hypothetical protein